MKRIRQTLGVCSVLGLLLAAPFSRAQDSPTTQLPATTAAGNNAAALAAKQEAEENYNSLRGHIDDLLAAQADQQKQILQLRKEMEELRQQFSRPAGNSVSQEDFKQLAVTVQEIDRKREADRDLILKEMEKLGHFVADAPARPVRNPVSNPAPSGGNGSGANQSGYWYTVKKDDTISLIVQGYREQGIKVTTKQVMDANPNLNPSKLYIGMKIFIPDAKKGQ